MNLNQQLNKPDNHADLKKRAKKALKHCALGNKAQFDKQKVLLVEKHIPIFLQTDEEFFKCIHCQEIFFNVTYTHKLMKISCLNPDCRSDTYVRRDVMVTVIA